MPVAKTDRDQWIAASLAFLAQGRSPADVSLADLCAAMKITKGSFYNHFPDGLPELHQAVIRHWLEARITAGATAQTVRNPLDRLRVLRDAANSSAAADEAMRRWNAGDPPGPGAGEQAQRARRDLAAAINEADRAAHAQLTEALADLGFTAREAVVLAAVLTVAFSATGSAVGPLGPTDPDAFESLLAVLRRAVPPAPAVETTTGQDDEIILYLVARDLDPGQRAQLLIAAKQFAAGGRQVSSPARTAEGPA